MSRPVAAAAQPLSLRMSLTNNWDKGLRVPNIAIAARPENTGFTDIEMLVPAVLDQQGAALHRARFVDVYVRDPSKLVTTLAPGQTISGYAEMTYTWGFNHRVGDFAITLPVYGTMQCQPRSAPPGTAVSNTCFLRVLPKGARVPAKPPKLALRIAAGARSFISDQAPISTDRETYVPARAAAALAGAQLTPGFDKAVLQRGQSRLVLLPHEGAAVLPGGKRVTGIAIPFARGEEAMVALSLLSQAFGVPKQLSMKIVEQKP